MLGRGGLDVIFSGVNFQENWKPARPPFSFIKALDLVVNTGDRQKFNLGDDFHNYSGELIQSKSGDYLLTFFDAEGTERFKIELSDNDVFKLENKLVNFFSPWVYSGPMKLVTTRDFAGFAQGLEMSYVGSHLSRFGFAGKLVILGSYSFPKEDVLVKASFNLKVVGNIPVPDVVLDTMDLSFPDPDFERIAAICHSLQELLGFLPESLEPYGFYFDKTSVLDLCLEMVNKLKKGNEDS